jgi:hypothetical protein
MADMMVYLPVEMAGMLIHIDVPVEMADMMGIH